MQFLFFVQNQRLFLKPTYMHAFEKYSMDSVCSCLLFKVLVVRKIAMYEKQGKHCPIHGLPYMHLCI